MKHTVGLAILAAFLCMPVNADIAGNPEKISGWVVVYEVDAANAVVRGSLAKLVNAAQDGADIKFMINQRTAIFTCEEVRIFDFSGTQHLGCLDVTNIALVTDPSLALGFQNPPFFGYRWIDTLRRSAIARASIYGGSDEGTSVSTLATDFVWLARIR